MVGRSGTRLWPGRGLAAGLPRSTAASARLTSNRLLLCWHFLSHDTAVPTECEAATFQNMSCCWFSNSKLDWFSCASLPRLPPGCHKLHVCSLCCIFNADFSRIKLLLLLLLSLLLLLLSFFLCEFCLCAQILKLWTSNKKKKSWMCVCLWTSHLYLLSLTLKYLWLVHHPRNWNSWVDFHPV